jgi:RNase P subunit RPR2
MVRVFKKHCRRCGTLLYTGINRAGDICRDCVTIKRYRVLKKEVEQIRKEVLMSTPIKETKRRGKRLGVAQYGDQKVELVA